MIVTHGWPGSIVEQMKIIDPLTNPTAHGGSASDAFDVVIPSIPGYGYSGKPTDDGLGSRADRAGLGRADEAARLRRATCAQGGDWGAVVVDWMGVQAPQGLLAIHTNMAGVFPAEVDGAAFSGAPAPAGLSDDEKVAFERLQFVYQKGIAYGYQWGCGRRPWSESRTHPSAWPPTSSITTRAATRSSLASSTDSPRA
jgi:pimeloyl-ACP methyl ester carboxylesterase